MKRFYTTIAMLTAPILAPIAARAATCPTGYISVDMPDVEIAETCEAGYTSAGTIDDCSTGAGVCAVADVNCEPGYYLNNGECKQCKSPYYCPGDNARYECPPNPDNPSANISAYRDSERTHDGATDISDCLDSRILVDSAEHGTLYKKCYYNESTGQYTSPCHFGGDALTFQKCDAGYYWIIPGADNGRLCFDSDGNCTCDSCTCTPVGIGFYSPADESTRTACDTGHTTRTKTAASASECVSLCTAGATMLHVGPHTFNLYPDEACARPAVHIGLPGGTCCAHLVKGEGTDALHVRYEGEVYHTTN